MVRKPETMLRTCGNAELASFADIMGDHNSSTNHIDSPFNDFSFARLAANA
jgi:hypothetical protein